MPVLIDDIDQVNQAFVLTSGEVYSALDECRWTGMLHPSMCVDTSQPITEGV